MELCQGAVILIDEQASLSDWVKQEAAILAWRRSRDPGFQLVPILVAPMTAAHLPALGFAPSDIGSLQMLSIAAGAADAADVWARTLLDALLQRLDGLHAGRRTSTSIERIEDLLVHYLKGIDVELIVHAAFNFGEDIGRWSPNTIPARALARLLLRAGLMDSIPVLATLPLEAPHFERVSRLLATAWINCRAVEPIHRVAIGPQERRALAINSDELLLAQWYLLRASGGAVEWPRIEVRLGYAEDDPDSVIAQVRDNLCRRGPPGIPPERYLAQLQSPSATKAGPIFLVFEAPEPDPEILVRLRQEFPGFTFFLLTGSTIPPPDAELSTCGGYFLRPEIRSDTANDAIAAWSAAFQHLIATTQRTL